MLFLQGKQGEWKREILLQVHRDLQVCTTAILSHLSCLLCVCLRHCIKSLSSVSLVCHPSYRYIHTYINGCTIDLTIMLNAQCTDKPTNGKQTQPLPPKTFPDPAPYPPSFSNTFLSSFTPCLTIYGPFQWNVDTTSSSPSLSSCTTEQRGSHAPIDRYSSLECGVWACCSLLH